MKDLKFFILLFLSFLIVLFSLSSSIFCSENGPPSIENIGVSTQGMGLTATNIDSDPRPDLFAVWVDNPMTWNNIRYSVLKNINSDFNNNNWSSPIIIANDQSMGYSHAGCGATFADLNHNNIPDLIIGIVDDPNGENELHIRIGFDINSDGKTSHWRHYKIPASDMWLGGETVGLGLAAGDIDKNGYPDLVMFWADIPGDYEYHYRILWNLDKDGNYSKIGDCYKVTGTGLHTESNSFIKGLGLDIKDLNGNGIPDIIFSYLYFDYNPHLYQRRYGIYWDMTSDKKDIDVFFNNFANQATITAGEGIVAIRVDEHYPYDLIDGFVDDPGSKKDFKIYSPDGGDVTVPPQENAIYFAHISNFEEDKQRGGFNNVDATKRVEMIRHLGKIIVFAATDNKIFYRIKKDDDSWSTNNFEELDFGKSSIVDNSVKDKLSKNFLNYLYRYKDGSVDISFKKYHVLSDGQYVYVFRATDYEITCDRYILDTDSLRLVKTYDVRNKHTKEKCGDTDKNTVFDYFDDSGNYFYEPTVVLNFYQYLQPNKLLDFTVQIVPTVIPSEKRWQFFILDESGKMNSISIRMATEDYCGDGFVNFKGWFDDRDKSIIYRDKNDGSEKQIVLPGYKIVSFTVADTKVGGLGSKFFAGPASVIFQNLQDCNGKVVKTGTRLMLICPTAENINDNPMIFLDFPVRKNGLVLRDKSDFDSLKFNFQDPACDDEKGANYIVGQCVYDYSDKTPFILNSSDGFIHIYFRHFNNIFERIYDPYKDKWINKSDSDAESVKGGAGWISNTARKPILPNNQSGDFSMSAAEYGSYTRDSQGKIKGILKRAGAFVKDKKVYYIIGDNVGDLDAVYIGKALVDGTLIGYIEGAPPVPSEIMTKADEDYSGISGVSTVTVDDFLQEFHTAMDWGFNFKTEGNVGWFAWEVESSYGFLSENYACTEHTTQSDISKYLTGEWDQVSEQWKPKNYGIALVKSKSADVYGLKLKDSQRIICYRYIPIEGSEERSLIRFKINPKYIKNGTLDGYIGKDKKDPDWQNASSENGSYYKPDELKALENKIQIEQANIDKFYNQQSRSAFSSVPDSDKISRQNFCNSYEWMPDGYYAQTESFANLTSESLGGSFSFLGMAGVSFGDPLFDSYEVKALAGMHFEKSFMKTSSSSHAFELDVYNDLNASNTEGDVDMYKWKTCYLGLEMNNFEDFYKRVVDKDWLNSDNYMAELLRDAQNRKNKVWRIRHFVTFVSRQYDEKKQSEENEEEGGKEGGTYVCTKQDDGSYLCKLQSQ